MLKIPGLRELHRGGTHKNPDEPSPTDIGEQTNAFKSIYRLLMLDSTEDFARIAVQFGGLADLMERFSHRIAAAGQIPITRWDGRSPAGMSATGESDMKNYVLMMEAMRSVRLDHELKILDEVLARDAGLQEAPEWKWNSLIELSDQEIAEAAKVKAEALSIPLADNVIDEDEYRAAIDGDPVFGNLPGEAPEPDPMDPDMMPPMPNAGAA